MSVPNWAALGITGLNWAFITDRGLFNILRYTGEQIDNRTSRSAFADKKSSNIKYTYLEHLDIISLTLAHFPKMLLYNFPVLTICLWPLHCEVRGIISWGKEIHSDF